MGVKYAIGIDLGGTKIEGLVLDASGGELFRKRVDTQQEKGYTHILGRVKGLHDELAAHDLHLMLTKLPDANAVTTGVRLSFSG
jgi:predicted NBD/HSP70 family sugar kinase